MLGAASAAGNLTFARFFATLIGAAIGEGATGDTLACGKFGIESLGRETLGGASSAD
jgi:hypothetical protein